MGSEHIYKQYDSELESVRAKVLEMGSLVEQQIVDALDALTTSNAKLAKRVINNDHLVNALEVQIDEDCSHIIALRQPAAGDLRMVLMMIKTITDLERIGDEAAKVARLALKSSETDRMWTPRFAEIKTMANLAREMLHMSLDSFARSDATKVLPIAQMDEQVDDQYQMTIRHLITFMLEDPRTISMSLEILFVSKAIERIGDHAKNISEYVVYMVKGKDVRHTTIEQMEEDAKS
ncbi:MAG: phosphate signaling complex protein PhoU [Methylotenera sp.]|uniref:phosphate signaling complex protein PhoU n=1 Tax=Methylotenera sp. TaxID=2051956 RepID=UPI0024892D05|nr:phosphate signaling complex protein PhoU [Methylotenera sp.]MDI1308295.1 phosphate signaling complex protein PhoU [Methylotenera sp.]